MSESTVYITRESDEDGEVGYWVFCRQCPTWKSGYWALEYRAHESAIGHAANTAGLQSEVGREGEQDYSWARASMDMGAKMLQTAGSVEFTYDGSTYG